MHTREDVLTSPDTLPYLDAACFRVPYAALGAKGPVDVELPDAGDVADEAGHDCVC